MQMHTRVGDLDIIDRIELLWVIRHLETIIRIVPNQKLKPRCLTFSKNKPKLTGFSQVTDRQTDRHQQHPIKEKSKAIRSLQQCSDHHAIEEGQNSLNHDI